MVGDDRLDNPLHCSVIGQIRRIGRSHATSGQYGCCDVGEAVCIAGDHRHAKALSREATRHCGTDTGANAGNYGKRGGHEFDPFSVSFSETQDGPFCEELLFL
jgi:hypothetical protein